LPEIFFPTPRAWKAVVAGFDQEGHPIEVEGTDLMARCLQHEIDHLNGRLFIDRLDGEVRRQALAALRERNISDATPGSGHSTH
jgi:peptide deformylase